jgi:hypothetical protein
VDVGVGVNVDVGVAVNMNVEGLQISNSLGVA